MNNYIPFLICLIAGLSTCLGFLSTYIKSSNIKRFICISLSFSAGVMLLLSIKELIPVPSYYFLKNYSLWKVILYLGSIALLALIIFNLSNKKINTDNSLYRVGVLSMITLLLHNIPEGVITLMSSMTNYKLGIKLGLAIMAHNIPEGICISVPIYYATKSRGKAFLYTFIAGIAEVIGALIIYILFKNYITYTVLNGILFFIGCLMILICIKELIPEAKTYKNNFWILYGFLLSLFILFI